MVMPPQLSGHWLVATSIGVGVIGAAIATSLVVMLRRRPTPEQIEERRRLHLAANGRIVDGSLVDAEPADAVPQTLIYRYRIAGVTYECSQDVSSLSTLVKDLRLGYPVQVRYNRDNPADSIVVSEEWNGLWNHMWQSSGVRPAAPLAEHNR